MSNNYNPPEDGGFSQKTPGPYYSRHWKLAGWLSIAVQLALPLALSFTPAIAAVSKKNKTTTVPYVLDQGETPTSVAKKHNISLDELQKLNVYRTFNKSFLSLRTGDEIAIPGGLSPFSIDQFDNTLPISTEDKLASGAVAAGSFLSSGNSGKAAANMARSAVTGEAGKSVEQWLGQYGTARAQLNLDEKMALADSALDVLVPLYDRPDSMLFTQLGIRNKDSRNTANIGAGARIIRDDWMYGINTFYDYDMTGKNRRLGIGTEAWTDYLKLSANGYFGLTDWHQSRDFADYNERPANGYDVRAEAYLPAYPQLGGKLMFEQYRGNEVALFGKDNRQKDPYAITAGLNYTPIPLLTLGTEYRAGKGGSSDMAFGLQLNYRLGESWQSQIDPSAVAGFRTLAGSRYDLVERNNNIVLNYQKQELMRMTLPEAIRGDAGSTAIVTAQVQSTHGLKNIDWDGSALTAAGGAMKQVSATAVLVTLPPYRTGNNVHMLSAMAHDNNGNSSHRVVTHITVNEQEVIATHSQTGATPDTLVADGSSTSQITVSLRDGNDLPIGGQASQLSLEMDFAADALESVSGAAPQSTPQLSDITEKAPGEYVATLTAGTQSGQTSITPSFNGQALEQVKISLVSAYPDAATSALVADPATIAADNTQVSTLTFSAKDANGDAMSGLSVDFAVSNVADTTMSSVTESDGVYRATLKGITAGEALVVPRVNGSPVAGLSSTVTMIERPILLNVAVNQDKAKNDETIAMTITATYEDGNPAAYQTLAIRPTAARNRQGNTEPITAVINGVTNYSGSTDNNGKLTLTVTDTEGQGVKTVITVTPKSGQEKTQEVIFTVITSPDVTQAAYYGHMMEVINGLQRPRLAAEVSGMHMPGNYNNETWAFMSFFNGNAYCTLGEIGDLTGSYTQLKTEGWPLPPASFANGFYLSRTITQDSYRRDHLWRMLTHTGADESTINSDFLGFIICVK